MFMLQVHSAMVGTHHPHGIIPQDSLKQDKN
jgi:hypothetical protein